MSRRTREDEVKRSERARAQGGAGPLGRREPIERGFDWLVGSRESGVCGRRQSSSKVGEESGVPKSLAPSSRRRRPSQPAERFAARSALPTRTPRHGRLGSSSAPRSPLVPPRAADRAASRLARSSRRPRGHLPRTPALARPRDAPAARPELGLAPPAFAPGRRPPRPRDERRRRRRPDRHAVRHRPHPDWRPHRARGPVHADVLQPSCARAVERRRTGQAAGGVGRGRPAAADHPRLAVAHGPGPQGVRAGLPGRRAARRRLGRPERLPRRARRQAGVPRRPGAGQRVWRHGGRRRERHECRCVLPTPSTTRPKRVRLSPPPLRRPRRRPSARSDIQAESPRTLSCSQSATARFAQNGSRA